jgi:hypothetical protein
VFAFRSRVFSLCLNGFSSVNLKRMNPLHLLSYRCVIPHIVIGTLAWNGYHKCIVIETDHCAIRWTFVLIGFRVMIDN